MIKLYTDISAAFEEVRKVWKPKRLDALVGYFGVGAAGVLKELGFRKIRFVFGLSESKPSLVRSKITELNQLENIAEIRSSHALHAKLYVMDDKVIIIGSANFTSAGFGSYQEAVIVTDEASVVQNARNFFATIWENTRPLNVKSIRPGLRNQSSSEETGDIGRRTISSQSLFTRTRKTSAAAKISTGKHKLSADRTKGRRPHASDYELESVGWVLYHAKAGVHAFGSQDEFRDALIARHRSNRLWYWPSKLGEAGRTYALILARDMEVFGHATAEVTHDITPNNRREGYKCAFHFKKLYLLERHAKKRIPFEHIDPKRKLTNFQGGLFRLSSHPWIIKNYEKCSGKKLSS